MIRTDDPLESALGVHMCGSEKASKRASEHICPCYVSPRAMNSDLASLKLVHPETRHFQYSLLGKAVILPGLCACKNKQATCLAETKTGKQRVLRACHKTRNAENSLKGWQPASLECAEQTLIPAHMPLQQCTTILCCRPSHCTRTLGFMQGCEVRALAGAPGCRQRMGQRQHAGHLCAGHMHQRITTCAGA